MWNGYFALGGREIGNSARARGLQESYPDCSIRWIKDKDDCSTLAEALGSDNYAAQNPYDYETISEAPWFDPDNVERSSRILGLYIVEMSGLEDDTRTVPVEQRVTEGARIGRTRLASRSASIRALLTADGRDALEAGMTWLKGALDGGSCGFHNLQGVSCGLSDFEYFVDCPPTHRTVYTYGSWALARTNLARAPRGQSGVNFNLGGASGSNPTNDGPDGGSYFRATKVGAATQGVGDLVTIGTAPWGGQALAATSPVLANTTYTESLWIRSSVALSVRIQAQSINGGAGGTAPVSGQFGDTVTVPANVWTKLSTTFTTPASGMPAVRIDVDLMSSVNLPNGATIDIGNILLETGSTLGAFFAGDSVPTDTTRYAWTGTAGNSTSTQENRTATPAQETDVAYAAFVNTYKRYMHSVKTISGPVVVEKFRPKDGRFVGNVVEFTIASEQAGVYTHPLDLNVPPSTPVVINDVPFNFVKQPRPINGITPKVMALKNLSANPSLETDGSGWSASQATVSGSSAASYFTSGRVTGELAAVGTAAMRARILGNLSTSATGRARMTIQQDVTLDNVNDRVSFNVWAAAVSVGGATGAALVSVTAKVEWRTAGSLISTTTIATSTSGSVIAGAAHSLKSQKPPATAVLARVIVEFVVDWSSNASAGSNSDIRAYVDALAVTVP